MSNQTKAILHILLVMIIWGSSFAVTKTAVATIPPIYFAFLRFLIASVILMIMYASKKKKPAPGKFPAGQVFFMGLTGVSLYYIFFNYSLVYTTASMGALIQAFIPVLIALLASVFLKEKLSALQLAGCILSITGVLFVGLTAASDNRSPDPLMGNLLMILAVAAWAVYTIISKKISEADVLQVTCFSTLAGTVLLIPFVVIELWHRPFPVLSFSDWMAVIYLGTFASALSYLLYNNALRDLPASLVGVFINLDPVIGAAIAVLFLKEQVTLWQIGGTFLVLVGVWLSAKKPTRQEVLPVDKNKS